MSTLNITTNWGLPLSDDYKIWWQSWDSADDTYGTSPQRDLLAKNVMNILDSASDLYRTMIEAGSVHSMEVFESREVPEKYSIERCAETAQTLLNKLLEILDGFTYVQIKLTQSGNGGGNVIPSAEIHFDRAPFGYKYPQTYSKYTFHITPKKPAFKKYDECIPNYYKMPKLDAISHSDLYIQNF